MNAQLDSRPVPVILASHPLPGFWPRSTPERPWCFRRSDAAASPVENMIDQFASDARYSPPVVVVSESAIRIASEQTARWQRDGLRLLAVPDGTRNGTAATLAALEIAGRDRRAPLLFLPATLAMNDGGSIARHIATVAANATFEQVAAIFVRKASVRDRGPLYEAGVTVGAGFRTAVAVRTGGASDEVEAALAAGALFAPAGPIICQAGMFLDAIVETAPMLLKSATSALTYASRSAHVVHPHGGFLSLVGDHSASEFIMPHLSNLLLLECGALMRTRSGWQDTEASGKDGAGNFKVGLAGIGDARIIEGAEGVFICVPGHEQEAARWYPSPGTDGPRQAPGVARHGWGTETLLASEYGVRILRFEIGVGQSLAANSHRDWSLAWSVSSGLGVATIAGAITPVRPGDLLNIPRSALCSLRNTGNEPLVIVEMRTGANLDSDDKPASYRFECDDADGATLIPSQIEDVSGHTQVA